MTKPSLRGSGADLYLKSAGGKKIVRRVPRKSTFGRSIGQQVEFESRLQQFISGQPFCAAFVSSDKASFTYEYIQGRDIFYSADGKKAGEAIARLHDYSSQNPVTFSKYSPAESLIGAIRSDALSKKEAIARLAGPCAEDVFSLAEKWPPPHPQGNGGGCLVHNDLTAGNIIIDDGGAARLIDWSWASHSDCALDLLSFTCPIATCWEYEHLISERAAKGFFSAYFAARQIQGDAKKAISMHARRLAMPYFSAMLLWLFSSKAESAQHGCAQERFSSPEFLKAAQATAARLAF